jgi:hypothetical protein
MVVTFHRLTRSLPLDIDAKVSFYNLSPAPTVIAPSPAAVAQQLLSSPVDPTTSALFGGASSALEHLYNATDGTNNFDKVVDFLGTMAEAESFKGADLQSHLIRLRNIPFPYRQRRRAQQSRRKRDLGQYDAKGVLRTSSFETAKKRLRAMMGNLSTLIV